MCVACGKTVDKYFRNTKNMLSESWGCLRVRINGGFEQRQLNFIKNNYH